MWWCCSARGSSRTPPPSSTPLRLCPPLSIFTPSPSSTGGRERERECKEKVKDGKKCCNRDMKPENLLLDKEGHLKVRKTKHLTFSQDQAQTFTDHWLWLCKEDHWQNVDLVWHSRVPGSWNNPIQGNADWRNIHIFALDLFVSFVTSYIDNSYKAPNCEVTLIK